MLLMNVIKDFSYVQEGQTIHAHKGQTVPVELRGEVERALKGGFAVLAEPEREAPKAEPKRQAKTDAGAGASNATTLEAGSIVRVKRKKGEPCDAEVLHELKDGVKVRFDDGKTATIKVEDVLEVIA